MEVENGYGKIEGKDAYHLLKVLRLREGDVFPIIDKRGYKGKALILSTNGYFFLTFRILSLDTYNPEFPFSVTLAQAPIKGKNMSFLLRKAAELGVGSIIPLITENTIARKVNIERWRKVVEEASKQSLRITIPEIKEPIYFTSLFDNPISYDVRIIFSPYSHTHIRTFLNNLLMPKSLIFLVGPEGGFIKEEIDYAKRHGFFDVSLGSRILRAETVPLVFLAILEYKWGRR